jgi:hypothetical protein
MGTDVWAACGEAELVREPTINGDAIDIETGSGCWDEGDNTGWFGIE